MTHRIWMRLVKLIVSDAARLEPFLFPLLVGVRLPCAPRLP